MKRRIVSFVLVMVIIISTSNLYVCATPLSSKNSIVCGGSYSTTEFSDKFGDTPSTLLPANEQSDIDRTQTTLQVNHIAVTGDVIDYSATIVEQGAFHSLNATGRLYNSFKAQNGINSIVGVLTDSSGNYEVLHFEIYNDVEEDFFYCDEAWRFKPHLKVYLRSLITDNILLFEMAIPKELNLITIDSPEHAEASFDGAWALPYLPYEVTVEQDVLETKATHQSTYTFPQITVSTVLQGNPVTWTSRTQLSYWFRDTTSAGGSISVRFNVISCTMTYLNTTSNVYNTPIIYSDLTLNIALGQYTAMHSVIVDGKVKDRHTSSTLGSGATVAIGIAAQAYKEIMGVAAPPVGLALTTMQWLNGLVPRNYTINLGGSTNNLMALGTVGYTLNLSNYFLNGTENDLAADFNTSYYDCGQSNPPQSISTKGAFHFTAKISVEGTSQGSLAMPILESEYVSKMA